MKRTVITLSSILAVGVAAYVVSHLHAQQDNLQQVNAAAPARNKVAVINLMGVVKKYKKWEMFEQDYKSSLTQWDKAFETRKESMLNLKKQFDATPEGERRDQLGAQMKQIEREAQDFSEKAKKELGKYREDQAVQIYKEVQTAVERFARSQGFGLVLHYADALTPAEVYHPINVMRKLQTQPCIPMYVDPDMDITNAVADMLNQGIGGQGAPTNR